MARLKSGALEVTVELELPSKADCRENGLMVVKNDSELDPVKVTVGRDKKKRKKWQESRQSVMECRNLCAEQCIASIGEVD